MSVTPEAALREYVASLEAFDVEVAMTHYDLPCIFLTSQLPVLVAGADELRGALGAQLDQMRADHWQRSEALNVRTIELASTLAIVTSEIVRYDTAGDEINRFRCAHTWRLRDRWLIAVVAVGDPAKGEWTERSLGRDA